MNKENFAFGRTNYILLTIGMAVVILGFILMSGDSSTEAAYNPDIFSARRIKVAPIVCLVGFLSMIYGVIYTKKTKTAGQTADSTTQKENDTKADTNQKSLLH